MAELPEGTARTKQGWVSVFRKLVVAEDGTTSGRATETVDELRDRIKKADL